MAHIAPHSQGGDMSADNLILLCKNCHKLHEPRDRPEVKTVLRQWKIDSIQENEVRFACECKTFNGLEKEVSPLLAENQRIFSAYGPHANDSEAHKLWQKFEPKIISNNAKIRFLLNKNKHLLSEVSCKIVDDFIDHSREFEATRDNYDGKRIKLFPHDLLLLFGIQREKLVNLISKVNPLQNLVAKLKKEKRFVSLSLREKNLIYLENGQKESLSFSNAVRFHQLCFSENVYCPKKTDMRLDNLIFTLEDIEKAGAKWQFDDMSDLTWITINGNYKVKLFYSYLLTLAEIRSTDLRKGKHVANLHNWNGAPISDDALAYAERMDVEVMTFDEFIIFCHRCSS